MLRNPTETVKELFNEASRRPKCKTRFGSAGQVLGL